MFYNPYFYFMPRIPDINNNPPTLYSILNSIANYGKEEKTKIPDLALATHNEVFNFVYPLSEKVNKTEFETLFLNRFLTRRIGFETFTAFQINLNVKLNMIMPKYNILFDSLIDWNILGDKEITERIGTDKTNLDSENNVFNITNTSTSTQSETNSTSDRRFSELPQNQISNVQNGSYMTQYNLDNNNSIDTSANTGTNTYDSNSNFKNEENKNYNEKITKTLSPSEKFSIYNEMQKNLINIYDMIFAELNDLFYSILN